MPTLVNLRAIVRRDPLLQGDAVSDSDLDAALNEGAVELAKDGHAMLLKASWNTAASTSEYVLSGASPKVSNFLDVYWPAGGLIYNPTSSVAKLPPTDFTVVSELWLNREYPGWRDLSASDTLQHVAFSYNTSGYLTLLTVPKASTTTPSFTLWYLSTGTAMNADDNYPWTNTTTNLTHTEPYQKGIAYYALSVLWRSVGQDTAQADKWFQLYQGQAAGLREAQRRLVTAETTGLRRSAELHALQAFGSL